MNQMISYNLKIKRKCRFSAYALAELGCSGKSLKDITCRWLTSSRKTTLKLLPQTDSPVISDPDALSFPTVSHFQSLFYLPVRPLFG